ncbi:MAG: putative NEK protein kinase [Streblomastix strix]|uniref:non-specific serine/threonine protein kinase n=1 Tax=Streblomastix strix TaxID=222440 RepID=A0A5J4W8R4_9EUKA|nr:MAG: putative NEK protein kinase [Streblomastix strix]
MSRIFIFQKYLGKGSFGEVQCVRRIADGNIYALKLLNLSEMKQREREDAANEIRILASIRHPNITRYCDSFVDDEKLYIDIKSANIFLQQNNIVKLGDLGVCKILTGTEQYAKSNIGTPYYIAPEIWLKHNYNRKVDIWSLGCD